MSENEPRDTLPVTGTGYANLTEGDSFSGHITVTENWVTIRNDNGRYTVPRRRIDFVNWKEV